MSSNEVVDSVKRMRLKALTFNEIGSVLGITESAARHKFIYRNIRNPKKRGPKRKLDRKHRLSVKRNIAQIESLGQKVNSTKILRNSDLDVSTRTVQRCLKEMGMKYKNATTQIMLSQKHKDERVRIISRWIIKNHCWEKTIFSDEKRFSLDGPDNWQTYVHKNKKPVVRNQRQCKGGGIMVWLMVLPNGLLCHKIIRGKFNSHDYLDMLSSVVVPIAMLNFGKEFWFQQDNCTVHKAKIIQEFFEISRVNILEWPAKSPDINITEDIWKLMSEKIYDGPQFSNVQELESAINECVNDINSRKRNVIYELYGQIRDRLCKVLYKRGNLYNK